jgi:hypothetical protein
MLLYKIQPDLCILWIACVTVSQSMRQSTSLVTRQSVGVAARSVSPLPRPATPGSRSRSRLSRLRLPESRSAVSGISLFFRVTSRACEDVVQKHITRRPQPARCRRLLAGEPRHPWFVTKVEFSAAPERSTVAAQRGEQKRSTVEGTVGKSTSRGVNLGPNHLYHAKV